MNDPAATCYHCQLPVPASSSWTVTIDSRPRPMCCPGCAAAAQAIIELGLDDYYQHRSAAPDRPELLDELRRAELSVWDDPQLEDAWAPLQGDQREAILQIEGMRCPACGWLVERSLSSLPGVRRCNVNYESSQALVAWEPREATLGKLLERVQRTGYRASPWRPDAVSVQAQQDSQQMMVGLGVAGIGMMQVMMYALGLYAGAWQGIEPETRELLRAGSLVTASLVLVFASRVFFVGAWHQLRALQPGMDVPVALAIGAAFGASLWHTWTGQGEVYFDSVCMFTFFLLLGRYLELRARLRAGSIAGNQGSLLPAHAWQIGQDGPRPVPAISLRPDTLILIRPGECCPADGLVVEGSSHVDESLLTGEPRPWPRGPGDRVTAGSMNLDHPLQVRVTAAGLQTRAATIERAVALAAGKRPRVAVLADRVARIFVPAVVLLTIGVWLAWQQIDASRAFDVALAVLVVSCPCALSLATPAALTATTRALRRAGVLVTGARALDALADVDTVIFDKTGTLTEGHMRLRSVITLGDEDETSCRRLAAALEAQDDHPIASALCRDAGIGEVPTASQVRRQAGAGIAGRVNNRDLRIGRADFAIDDAARRPHSPADDLLSVLLSEQDRPLAWFLFEDELRPDARQTVSALQGMGLQCGLLSGDTSARTARYAAELGIASYAGDCTPEDKQQRLERGAQQGQRILMIGDGVNDAPSLQAASVSAAMDCGSDLSRARADAVLLSDRLIVLPDMIRMAVRTRQVIRQNLAWAVAYNLCALPVAACGLIPPWVSALGMSASSLLVTLNALRLSRPQPPPAV